MKLILGYLFWKWKMLADAGFKDQNVLQSYRTDLIWRCSVSECDALAASCKWHLYSVTTFWKGQPTMSLPVSEKKKVSWAHTASSLPLPSTWDMLCLYTRCSMKFLFLGTNALEFNTITQKSENEYNICPVFWWQSLLRHFECHFIFRGRCGKWRRLTLSSCDIRCLSQVTYHCSLVRFRHQNYLVGICKKEIID